MFFCFIFSNSELFDAGLIDLSVHTEHYKDIPYQIKIQKLCLH